MKRRQPASPTALKRLAAILLLALAAGSAGAADSAGMVSSTPLTSNDRLRQLMEQVRLKPSASQAGGQAVREAVAVSPARLKERADLLKTGEAALARLDVAVALDAFERAALILHAADTEIALVRGYLQAGDYRRALAFGAHTAGAHLDVIGGSLLYAWLLHVGGQPVLSQRLMDATQARLPGNAMLQAVQAQLRSGMPRSSGQLLAPPTRLAPYGNARGLPEAAHVAGTAVLLPGGKAALLPLQLLPRSGRLWLRNGLGQLAGATAVQRLTDAGLAVVRLKSPLPAPDGLMLAARDAFAGSPGFVVEYVPSPDALPAWPVLRSGFLGSASGESEGQRLGIDLPAGTRGGPVFDAAGQLVGLALPGRAGAGDDRLVTVSQLRKALAVAGMSDQPAGQQAPAPAGLKPRASVDQVYEDSLKTSLQVITAP